MRAICKQPFRFKPTRYAHLTLLVLTPALGAEYFASPSGTADGDGSAESPWSLAIALSQPPAVHSGDTIWLLGGTYRGTFTSWLTGAADAPIVVRAFPGERAIIDGGASQSSPLTVNGAWAWYWGFEVINSDPNRAVPTPGSSPPELTRGTGITVFGPHTKLINLIIHDTAQGFGFWSQAEDSELAGNIIFYNGWDAPDRGHGHAIYTQNQTGTKRIVDNIMFGQFGYGIHAYGSSAAYLNNFDIEGNISFNNGALSRTSGFSTNILVGGGRVAENAFLLSNYTYFTPPVNRGSNNFGYSAGCTGLTATDNYFAGGQALGLVRCDDAQMTGNTFIGRIAGFSAAQYPDNTYYSSTPGGTYVVVRPNPYEIGRGHIVVYNWDLNDSVEVDISSLGLAVGDRYEVRNAQNYDQVMLSGIFDGGPLVLSMTDQTVAVPIGWDPPATTLPEFGAFVLARIGSGANR